MPHIDPARREVCLELTNVTNWGELHFFFGQHMQTEFMKDPSYMTLCNLRRFYVQTAHRQEYFKKIRQALKCPIDDVLNEAALAWEEFYLSVGHSYEEVKAVMNPPHAYLPSLRMIGNMLKDHQDNQVKPLIIPVQSTLPEVPK